VGLETTTYINGLIAANPVGTDDQSQGDDHIRLIKSAIKNTFPNITGAITPTQIELNVLAGGLAAGEVTNTPAGTITASEAQAALNQLDTLKAALAGAAFTGPVSLTTGDVNLKTNTALSDAAATLTAAQLIGGEFTITPTVARILTTDTAANIISALSGSVDNSNFEFTVINLAAFDVTIALGTDVTLVGNMVVNDGSATFRARRLTSSTVSITRLETGSGVAANPEVTGSTVFTQSTNNIGLTGVGSIGLEIGDVVQVTGTASNNKLFTVEVITDSGNVIVNQAHAGGTTSKSLVDETVSATVTLLARAINAGYGQGQGWCVPSTARSSGTTYTNNYKRLIVAKVDSNYTGGLEAEMKGEVDGATVQHVILQNIDVASTLGVSLQVPPGNSYKITNVQRLSLRKWSELR